MTEQALSLSRARLTRARRLAAVYTLLTAAILTATVVAGVLGQLRAYQLALALALIVINGVRAARALAAVRGLRRAVRQLETAQTRASQAQWN